ncbi:MAG: SMP-30/gluconolactonase/LRE family protein [Wenzhouxiangellaceae bacterium]|nr:SMP-30/gluconolactonase/LRE family protein [Wenzhouxiangellaceae bacterium]
MQRLLMIPLLAAALAACSSAPNERQGHPVWTLDDVTLFPPDRSLTHAEDGVALPDGTLLVGDFDHGLVAIAPDGSTRPFGDFQAAGFISKPALGWSSPNGISMEPDGRHVLVADITEGKIFRVDSETQQVTRILDHPYGVNSVIRDPSGAVWFTQSTENPGGPEAEARMFAAAERPLGDGAVYRMAPEQVGRPDPQPQKVIDGLDFANGIVYDAGRDRLYVAELLANRILTFDLGLESGRLSNRRVLAEVTTPDNLELDEDGTLWIASPIGNAVVVVDPGTGRVRTAFDPTPETSQALTTEWNRRLDAGESTLDLLGPGMFEPLPGLVTGIILTPDGGPVYVSGLGNALVKLER